MTQKIRLVPLEDDVIRVFLNWLNKTINADFFIKYRPDKIKGGNQKKEIDYIAEDRITGRQIAIEESSFWRHEQAGKEAADWTYSINHIEKNLSGRVKGLFNISTPISFFVPKKDLDDFSDKLLAKLELLVITLENSKIKIDGENWYKLTKTCLKPLDSHVLFADDELPEKRFMIKVSGISLNVNYENQFDSKIDFIRRRKWEDDDRKLFLENMVRIVEAKEIKLKPYRNRGLETWLVIYSTLWTTTNIREIQAFVNGISETYFNGVDHLILVSCNPPNDARVDELKIPGRKY